MVSKEFKWSIIFLIYIFKIRGYYLGRNWKGIWTRLVSMEMEGCGYNLEN